MRGSIIVAGLLLAITPATGSAQAPIAGSRDELQTALADFVAESNAPGATAALARVGDREVVSLATGVADREQQTPMTEGARMPAGSVGKMFAAATAVSLIQEGALGLDTPVKRWLGERPWFSRVANHEDITLRMLLSHTSGLRNHVRDEDFRAGIREQVVAHGNREFYYEPEELVEFVLDDPPVSAPGQSFNYSDTNYILVGLIIEQVTGQDYYDVVEERFLDPLDLDDTRPQTTRRFRDLVAGYAPNNPFGVPEKVAADGKLIFHPGSEWTGGGFMSSARDLAQWMLALASGTTTIGAPGSHLMVQGGPDATENQYGLGVSHSSSRFGLVYGHDGVFPGYRTKVAYLPEHDLVVSVQANASSGVDLGAAVNRLAGVLLESDEPTEAARTTECASNATGFAGTWDARMQTKSGRQLEPELILESGASGYRGRLILEDVTWPIAGTVEGEQLTLQPAGEPSGEGADDVKVTGPIVKATLADSGLEGTLGFLMGEEVLDTTLQWTAERRCP